MDAAQTRKSRYPLSFAQTSPRNWRGQALIASIALGVDMRCRRRMGAGKSKAIGWMAETMAPMSVAAMGSALLGLYRLHFRGDYGEAALLGDLGERNEIANVSLKPYPTCKYTHHAIATAIRLVEAHDVTAEQVRRVTVATNTMGVTQCGFDATGAPRIAPETAANAAKFSILYTVAAAIARRRVTLAEFTEASIRDPALRDLAARVQTRVDPAKDALPMLYPPMDVTIETTDGRVLSRCEEFVKGDPRDPATSRPLSGARATPPSPARRVRARATA